MKVERQVAADQREVERAYMASEITEEEFHAWGGCDGGGEWPASLPRPLTASMIDDSKRQVTRSPSELVPLIQEDLRQADEAGLPYFRAAGEKMLEAKEQIKHGEFGKWIERNFKISKVQASHYMNFAKAMKDEKLTGVNFSSLKDFIRQKPKKPPPPEAPEIDWKAAYQKRVNKANVERLSDRKVDREIALQLVDEGYKALAVKFHPDKPGGTTEAMARLNKARVWLKGWARRLDGVSP